ncbi:MAG: glycosyltransferase family 4 protein [Ignavibacteriaceae bacterium]|nr:glycosyltransferase family 4 protein [Ignavibacteriaceae bacterium]
MELTGKKILIIVENLPVPFDRRVWQEANTLKSFGAQIIIVCPKNKQYEKPYEVIDGIHIYRHPLPSEGNGAVGYLIEYSASIFWQLIYSFKIYIKHGVDIIQACNPPDLIFISVLPFKLIGKKFIFDHHDINPELYLAKFNKKDLFYRLLCLLEKITFKVADISIATNESYKEIAIKRGGMKREKVHVVRSGPKLERIQYLPPKNELKKGKEFLIAYVGVIGQQEGIDHLLEAISILVNKYKINNFYCIICGGGTYLEFLKEYSVKLNLQEYVRFTGRILDNELFEILNTADICVNPDVWNEMNDKSTMNKIMEYMALAKPIVQYDLKEGRFSAQSASLYAKPNDRDDFARKIIELFDNADLRKEMGEFGKNRVENVLQWKYEEPKLKKAYIAAYEN